MANNLELGRATKASKKAGTLQNIKSRKGAGNGNAVLHSSSAGILHGHAKAPNVPRQAEFIKGNAARGKAQETKVDVFIP